jgi:hypothetical protein
MNIDKICPRLAFWLHLAVFDTRQLDMLHNDQKHVEYIVLFHGL